jgi:ADP-L-glycero-D-manno-heptose 6-epimerase
LDWLARHASSIDAVIHMGAISATTERDVDKIVNNNIRLTLDLWSTCTLNNLRFVYASSAATYGDGASGFHDDEDLMAIKTLQPLNAYGWSKWVIDRRFASYVAARLKHPPQWVGLRFFNVYGPFEDHKEENAFRSQ